MKVNPEIEFFRKQVPTNRTVRSVKQSLVLLKTKRVHWLKTDTTSISVPEIKKVSSRGNKEGVLDYAVQNNINIGERVQVAHKMKKNLKNTMAISPEETEIAMQIKQKSGRVRAQTVIEKVAHQTSIKSALKKTAKKYHKTTESIVHNESPTTNYYYPLTENFSKKMTSNFAQAIKAIDSTRLSFQQAITKQTVARMKLSDKGVGTCVSPPIPKQDGTWTKIHHQKASLKDSSNDKETNGDKVKLFPGKLPYVTSPDQPSTNPPHHMYTTGVTVTVKLPDNLILQDSKFLEAMLACFRTVDDWAEIIPFEYSDRANNPAHKVIKSLAVFDDTKFDSTEYLEEPIRKRFSKEFVTRIKVRTSVKMSEILKDRDVKTWLRQERVYPEINNLSSAHLVNVGFLYEAFPRGDSLDLYTARIKKALNHKGPNFHLNITTIFTEKCKTKGKPNITEYIRSQVIVIRTTSYDAQVMHKEMANLKETLEFTYNPWKEFMSLSSAQKRTIIIGQEKFIKEYKILQIPHFTSAVTETFMHTVEDTNEIMIDAEDSIDKSSLNLRKTTVLEFLMEHYIAGDGLSLFTYIFSPINGIMEVLVAQDHLIEAKDCLAQIWEDIRFYANDATIERVLDPIVVEDSSMRGYIPWKPFTLTKNTRPTAELPSEIQVQFSSNDFNTSNTITTPSYAAALRHHGGRTVTSMTARTVSSDSTESVTDHQCELTALRKQYDDLIKSVEAQTQKLEEIEATIQGQGTYYDQMETMIENSEKRTMDLVTERMQLQGDILVQKFSAMIRETFTTPMPTPTSKIATRSSTAASAMTPRKRHSEYTAEKSSSSSSSDSESGDDDL